ncbi:MAG: hypothetical protein SGJ19_07855 [Planctomycetia bacterium]|nr:hypothetical protein [Planctomycetia bacterium]
MKHAVADDAAWVAELKQKRINESQQRDKRERPGREFRQAAERLADAWRDNIYLQARDDRCVNPHEFTTAGVNAVVSAVVELQLVLKRQGTFAPLEQLRKLNWTRERDRLVDAQISDEGSKAFSFARDIISATDKRQVRSEIKRVCDTSNLLADDGSTHGTSFAFEVGGWLAKIVRVLGGTPVAESTSEEPIPGANTRSDRENSVLMPIDGKPDIEFDAGCFVLWGHPFEASGQPLIILERIASSHHRRQNSNDLKSDSFNSDGTIRGHLSVARKLLRGAISRFIPGYSEDPLPSSKDVKGSAYRLALPTIPAQIQR